MGIERCTRIGVLFVGALAAAACGGSDESGGEIDLIGGEQVDDEMGGFAFAGEQVTGDAPTITVQAGEEVTVNFENVGNTQVAADLALAGIGMARFSTRQWCVRHLRLVMIVCCPSRSGRDMLNESALS